MVDNFVSYSQTATGVDGETLHEMALKDGQSVSGGLYDVTIGAVTESGEAVEGLQCHFTIEVIEIELNITTSTLPAFYFEESGEPPAV